MQLTGPDGTLEFNVDPDQSMIKIGNGAKAQRFKKVDLWALVFAMSGPEEQDKMMPVRQTELVTYRRIHNIKVKRNLKAGDTITCKCEINVPQTVVEGLKGMVEQQKKTAGGFPIIGGGKSQIVLP